MKAEAKLHMCKQNLLQGICHTEQTLWHTEAGITGRFLLSFVYHRCLTRNFRTITFCVEYLWYLLLLRLAFRQTVKDKLAEYDVQRGVFVVFAISPPRIYDYEQRQMGKSR